MTHTVDHDKCLHLNGPDAEYQEPAKDIDLVTLVVTLLQAKRALEQRATTVLTPLINSPQLSQFARTAYNTTRYINDIMQSVAHELRVTANDYRHQ